MVKMYTSGLLKPFSIEFTHAQCANDKLTKCNDLKKGGKGTIQKRSYPLFLKPLSPSYRRFLVDRPSAVSCSTSFIFVVVRLTGLADGVMMMH